MRLATRQDAPLAERGFPTVLRAATTIRRERQECVKPVLAGRE
jgi:hypothetical protein